MSISSIQNQAAMARNADVGKLEQSKDEINAKRKLRQLEKEKELTDNKLNSLNDVIDETNIEHLNEEELEKRRKRRKAMLITNSGDEDKSVFKDTTLGSNIDISV